MVSSGIPSFWGTSSNNKSLKWLRFDRTSFDGPMTVTMMRGVVTRMAGDVTVMRVTSVGNGELVLRGFSEMVVDGSEDLGNGGEGGR